MNKPWWTNNGTLKTAVWISALVFAAGGGWSKLNAIQRSVDSLDVRVGHIEGALMGNK